jgi:hypothetical protein
VHQAELRLAGVLAVGDHEIDGHRPDGRVHTDRAALVDLAVAETVVLPAGEDQSDVYAGGQSFSLERRQHPAALERVELFPGIASRRRDTSHQHREHQSGKDHGSPRRILPHLAGKSNPCYAPIV